MFPPDSPSPHDGPIPYDPSQDDPAPAAGRAARVLARHERRLLQIEGVTGVGIGAGPTGEECIFVYALHNRVRVPRELDGVDVFIVVTGPIDAQ